MTADAVRRPSDASLARAGELLYRALERLATEDAERDTNHAATQQHPAA